MVTTSLWYQFGAALDMLENAMSACPAELWSDQTRKPQFWYLVYHTLFYLDFYLADPVEGFNPPAPYTLNELDPRGVLPEQPYDKKELQAYLQYGRDKCRATIAGLTDERLRAPRRYGWVEGSVLEILLYNMRHVQHHTGQLNLILRQEVDAAPVWVAKTDR